MREVVKFQFYEIKMCLLFIFGSAISLLFVEVSEGTTLDTNLSLKGAEWVRNDVLRSLAKLEADDQSPYSLGQFSLGFLDQLEVSNQCLELLHSFTIKCVSHVDCTLRHARPVRVCENCYQDFSNLQEIYRNISQESLVNVSCRDTLLRSDRLQVIVSVYEFLNGFWGKSECSRCLTKEDSISNDTLNFMNALNQSLDCFQKFQQSGNLSELCKQCKGNYSRLSELYSQMEKNFTLCIDIEDAMNMTRRLWSKNFNCSFPREETVPVIAVSSFMLFLPVIFYLSSFLHSKQKKRKLIPHVNFIRHVVRNESQATHLYWIHPDSPPPLFHRGTAYQSFFLSYASSIESSLDTVSSTRRTRRAEADHRTMSAKRAKSSNNLMNIQDK